MRRFLITCVLAGLFCAAAISAHSRQTAASSAQPQALVVRVTTTGAAQLAALRSTIDVWAVYPNRRGAYRGRGAYVDALVQPDQYFALLAQGYHIEINPVRTAQLNRPAQPRPGQAGGIPGYSCYRTVEETYAAAQSIVSAHPDLAQWIDIGDSWEKKTSGGAPGYDLRVLKLTNPVMAGPKPRFFVMSSIHAREYAPAELNTRFAEYLIDHYGVDPDVTWLLDYNEVHLLLQANPDGRKEAESGLLWRKNTDNDYCANSDSRGADLNRNYPFYWNSCPASDSLLQQQSVRSHLSRPRRSLRAGNAGRGQLRAITVSRSAR